MAKETVLYVARRNHDGRFYHGGVGHYNSSFEFRDYPKVYGKLPHLKASLRYALGNTGFLSRMTWDSDKAKEVFGGVVTIEAVRLSLVDKMDLSRVMNDYGRTFPEDFYV